MDDRRAEDDTDAERPRRLLAGSRHRWHPAPDDPLLFVLDDGTGDVELRFRPEGDILHASLTRLDREADRFEIGRGDVTEAAFVGRLDEAVTRLASARSADGGKGRTRFIVSFDPAQLTGLREIAEREDVPVAEVVRRAVDAYLARGGSPAGPAGG